MININLVDAFLISERVIYGTIFVIAGIGMSHLLLSETNSDIETDSDMTLQDEFNQCMDQLIQHEVQRALIHLIPVASLLIVLRQSFSSY